ncbi:hypothetical protein DQ04_00601240 [Trypanosoma grayi]|uniref:hypothetical protein n=1 Tax=Trypanosoma grayi TaxID=71804 RepID=UPI0004F470A8|nr:hypothetical protein DQ04_00601240 [Trypanosoma grayi]KEG14157.1 hypothetical protein DQ04_00601240 [Trypanosoma grayi]
MRYSVQVADNMHIESIPWSSMKSVEQMAEHTNAAMDNESVQEEAAKEPENADGASSPVEVDVGASQAARDVVVQGALHIDGILTRIVVKPELPDPPVVPQKRKKSKAKKNAKALQEEQERLEAEAKLYEEKVEAAVAAAREEEERRMQFAHPDRWPHVTFANMTFAGQVIVSHSHVRFQNCCFVASAPEITQLLVAQYCQVECLRCAFECPIKASVYGWPRGQLTFQRCIFTGFPQNDSGEEVLAASPREVRPKAVGLHTDSCKVTLEGCQFTGLGTGILLRGSIPGATAEAPAMVVKGCKIDNIFGTGVILENVHGVELVKNKITDCDYYALDCIKGRAIHVFQNAFTSQVRVQDAAHAKFLHNKSGTVPLNLKEVENPNWQPVY